MEIGADCLDAKSPKRPPVALRPKRRRHQYAEQCTQSDRENQAQSPPHCPNPRRQRRTHHRLHRRPRPRAPPLRLPPLHRRPRPLPRRRHTVHRHRRGPADLRMGPLRHRQIRHRQKLRRPIHRKHHQIRRRLSPLRHGPDLVHRPTRRRRKPPPELVRTRPPRTAPQNCRPLRRTPRQIRIQRKTHPHRPKSAPPPRRHPTGRQAGHLPRYGRKPHRPTALRRPGQKYRQHPQRHIRTPLCLRHRRHQIPRGIRQKPRQP